MPGAGIQSAGMQSSAMRGAGFRCAELWGAGMRVQVCRVEVCGVQGCDVQGCDVQVCGVQRCGVQGCGVQVCRVQGCGVQGCRMQVCGVQGCRMQSAGDPGLLWGQAGSLRLSRGAGAQPPLASDTPGAAGRGCGGLTCVRRQQQRSCPGSGRLAAAPGVFIPARAGRGPWGGTTQAARKCHPFPKANRDHKRRPHRRTWERQRRVSSAAGL